jgi:hypothetical protein
MSTDRELLELAAKAAGVEITGQWSNDDRMYAKTYEGWWNPLVDDGDALRLAVKLHLEIDHNHPLDDDDAWVMAIPNGLMTGPMEEIDGESYRLAATRRAIVRAAASMASP